MDKEMARRPISWLSRVDLATDFLVEQSCFFKYLFMTQFLLRRKENQLLHKIVRNNFPPSL
jgi:hypothetical protein